MWLVTQHDIKMTKKNNNKKTTIRIYDFLAAQHQLQRERTVVCACLFAFNIHPFPYRVFT